MKNILISIQLILLSAIMVNINLAECLGQHTKTPLFASNHTLLFEFESFGGFSLRHEWFFYQKGRSRLAVGLGFSFFLQKYPLPYPIPNKFYRYGIPVIFFYTLSSKNLKSHLEVGLGYHFLNQENVAGTYWTTIQAGFPPLDSTYKVNYNTHITFIRIGYRWQRPGKGIFFKLGYYPFSFRHFQFKYPDFDPRVYLGIGWSF